MEFSCFPFGTGIPGCGPAPEAAPVKPVVCTPQATNVNVYRAASASISQTSSYTVTPSGTSGASGMTTPLSADQALALLQGTLPQSLPSTIPVDSYSVLGTLVNDRVWSDIQTVNLSDSNKAQIVVTFLSPQMIQAVLNSEVSIRGYAMSNPSTCSGRCGCA